jgi:hypothetical protein
MSILKNLLFASLAATASIANAEPHCPGNVASLRLRLIQNVQIVVPVEINHAGTYDFLLDTGAQITTVDPALAKSLGLKVEGTTGVIGVGNYARTPYTRLDSVQAGNEAVEHLMAVIQNLGQIQMADSQVRGVLGGNFLENFGLLIDYRQHVVCLDKGDAMESKMKGQHISLGGATGPEAQPTAPQRLTVAVHLSGVSKESLLMRLDSGINVPLLYASADTARLLDARTSPLKSRGTDGVEHAFAVLARQDVRIGGHSLQAIPFVMPVTEAANAPKPEVDGLLPTALFERVYINYGHHYAVLEP